MPALVLAFVIVTEKLEDVKGVEYAFDCKDLHMVKSTVKKGAVEISCDTDSVEVV